MAGSESTVGYLGPQNEELQPGKKSNPRVEAGCAALPSSPLAIPSFFSFLPSLLFLSLLTASASPLPDALGASAGLSLALGSSSFIPPQIFPLLSQLCLLLSTLSPDLSLHPGFPQSLLTVLAPVQRDAEPSQRRAEPLAVDPGG